ncbi:MFS transporter [Olivibacter sitiensis]|uniref:MFS transporter n=1 Tax=Olivibacter sitiensis TaxID=376470 RepID=UPI0004101EC5|nr:MFS transporter [Olivibacter sitiensis]
MSQDGEELSDKKVRLKIAQYVVLSFYGYLCIGLPLAVLPVFIHVHLGFSTFVAGAVISLQYLMTFMVRGYAGRLIDTRGPKSAVSISMLSFVLSGILLVLAFLMKDFPVWSLILIMLGRLITGCAEGMIGASPINWAMLVVGERHTATAISYNGIASYGALAVGAPLGVWMAAHVHYWSLGLLIIVVGLYGYLYAQGKPVKVIETTIPRQPFFKVLRIVSPFGICLALGGIGFGTISTFITLYYAQLHWPNAAFCLTVFSGAFILGRIFFGTTINRFGGIRVALYSLATESLGLVILWLASDTYMAMLGASIAGLGFALVFPALGVEAVKLVSLSSKGTALAAYGLFVDISLGITGPMVGFVANHYGLLSIFPFSAIMVTTGLFLCLYMHLKKQHALIIPSQNK